MVTLEDLSNSNIHDVMSLQVRAEQKAHYPRSNAYSIAEGKFPPDEDPVVMKAICYNKKPVGFMMTSEATEQGAYFLWRMMLDQNVQGLGYGGAAIRALINRVKNSTNPRVLLLSHTKENLPAARFFAKFGFSYTGNMLGDNDLEMQLRFDD